VSAVLRVTTRLVMAGLALPDPLLRRLVGRPVRVDEGDLSPTAQLLIKLQALAPMDEPHLIPDLARARREFDIVSTALTAAMGRSVRVQDTALGGSVRARIYTPPAAIGPLLVYFHGGGFALGSLASHDGICRFLSEHSGVRIVSVDYRLAPEHPYPAAIEDALAAFRYVVADPARFGSPDCAVGVGGDSAGGTIAAVVAQRCAIEGSVTPAFNLMIYPPLNGIGCHPSRNLFGHGFFIDADTIAWYQSAYVPDAGLLTDPGVSPLRARGFAGLPPTCVVTAGFDPFRDEGVDYVHKLRAEDVQVTHLHHDDQLHGFAAFADCDAHARRAALAVAEELRRLAAATPFSVPIDPLH
jgi:acetyl esterase